MLGAFNFFDKKLKSADNSNKNNNYFRFSKDNIQNKKESSIIPKNKRKKSKFLEKEISGNTTLEFMNLVNVSPKHKRKESSLEKYNLFNQYNKGNRSSNSNKRDSQFLKELKAINKSSKINIISSKKSSFKISSINFDNNVSYNESNKVKKRSFLELNKPRNEFYDKKFGKTPKAPNSKYFNSFQSLSAKYAEENFKNECPESSRILARKSIFGNMDYYQNNLKMFQINEHIQNEIDSLELKKKVKRMKKSIIKKSSKKLVIEEEISSQLKTNENIKDNINLKSRDENESKDGSHLCLKKESDDKNNINTNDKFRRLKKLKQLYDSFDDEEYEDDFNNEYYISPSSYLIKIFDCLIFFSSLFYLIFVPYFFSNNSIIVGENKIYKLILVIIDFIYIIDIILNFFRAYQNFDENLIKKTKSIFIHYLRTWFLIDFFQSIPIYTFIKYFEKTSIKDNFISNSIEGKINPILYLVILIKVIKVYKMINENSTITGIAECLTKNEIIYNYGNFIISIFFSLCFLNLCACSFIFIGKNSCPGWIMKKDILDKSYIHIYIVSLYFILVTITTVGYGDITGDSCPEIIFQMFLLIIGTIAYSFIISYISNYIVKMNQKSRTFEKNVRILEEIRLNNPHLKDSIYQEVLKNLHNEQLYERKDKSFLFDCLPYTLKNKLIMEMYKYYIDRFIFFRDIDNSDFIVKVVTSLKPLLSFRGDLLVQEGDFVKEIFFVKKGVLSLNITIDRDNQEESIKKYFKVNEGGNMTLYYNTGKIISSFKNTIDLTAQDNLENYLTNKKEKNIITPSNGDNIDEIKIIEIRRNEHFGVALMFLDEKCPLLVKTKSKTSELLVLRKMEAIEIYSIYPNIWNRINKKSLFNLAQIKNKIRIKLFSLAKKFISNSENSDYKKSKFMESLIHYNESVMNYSNNKISNKSLKIIKNFKEEKEEEEKYNKNETRLSLESKKPYNKSQINAYTKSQIKRKILTNKFKSNDNIPKCLNTISKQSSIKTFESLSNKDTSIEINNLTKTTIDQRLDTNKSLSYIFNSNLRKNDSSNKANKKTIKNRLILPPLKMFGTSKNNSNIIFGSCYYTKNNYNGKISCINNEKEKIYFHSFSNLSKISESSFQLNSSYENLNAITNNKYIKNNSLQSKTKLFLINECSLVNDSPKSKNYLLLKNPISGQIVISSSLIKEKSLLKNFDLKSDKRSVNSHDNSKIKSYRKNSNDSITSFNNYNEKNFEMTRKRGSLKNSRDLREIKFSSNMLTTKYKSKSPKMRKNSDIGVNKKLDIISKNIKGASRNINNPEEFYMDLFNNIILNKKDNNNKLNKYNSKFINKTNDSVIEKNNKNINNKSNSPVQRNMESSIFSLKKRNQLKLKINGKPFKRTSISSQ